MMVWRLVFILLIWCIHVLTFLWLTPLGHSIKFTIEFRGYLHLCHKRYWFVVFLWCLCLVLVSGQHWSHRINWKILYPILFLEEFVKDWCWLFFKHLLEFTTEAIWFWLFLLWEVFSLRINLFSCIDRFMFPILSWVSLSSLCFPRNLSVSSTLYNNYMLAYDY